MTRLFALLLFCSCSLAFAQTTFQDQAARLQNINAFLQDFRPVAAPRLFSENVLELYFEAYPQPDIDTTVGRKEEPVNPPEIVPKVRARYLLKNGFFVGGSVVPGIEFEGYDADTVAAEAGWRRGMFNGVVQLRLSYSDGDVVGPVTEETSNDEFSYTNLSADLSYARRIGPLDVYGFLGTIDVETELLVQSDMVLLENTEATYYAGLGATWQLGRWSLTAEQNITDDYLANIIVALAYRF